MGTKTVILILIMAVAGCAHLIPSVGFIHQSNPDAGLGSPHPERNELSCNFLGGGATIELPNTDIHLWLGGRDCNNADPVQNVAIIVAHKFRKRIE